MIWVIAGTKDGREIAARLADDAKKKLGETDSAILVTVVSTYGKRLAMHEGLEIEVGRFTKEDMLSEIEKHGITVILDCSHPYAAIVSETAQDTAKDAGISYVRYERPAVPLPDYEKLYCVKDEEEAAQVAGERGSRILLTTGSKTLATFLHSPALSGKEIWARVLPTSSVLLACEALGLSPKYILALEGPFSYDMNRAMIADYQIDVLVTKNSGTIGGGDAKFSAAVDAGISVVVIDKPKPKISGFPIFSDSEMLIAYMEGHDEFY